MQGQSGGLPLLQYALARLWEERSGNRLTLEGYQAIGGFKGALEQRADQIYAHLDDQQQAACRRIFLRLTEPGEGTEDTRRRARLDELGTDEATQTSLQALIVGRLVTSGEGAEGMVEVSHEALIRGWPLLQGWIEADREALRIQHRLNAAAREWMEHDRDPDSLYRGARLSQAEEWSEIRRDDLSADDVDCLLFPGGYSPDALRLHEPTLALVRECHTRGKLLAAICHGPWILISAGVVAGKRATGYVTVRDDLVNAEAEFVDVPAVQDGNIVTGRVPDDLSEFCQEIIKALSD